MLSINSNYYMCLIFRTNKIKDLNETLAKTIKNRLEFKISHVLGGIHLNEIIFILFDDKLISKRDRDKFNILLKEIKKYTIKNFNIKTSIGMSKVFHNIPKIHIAYNEAKHSILKGNNKNEGLSLYSYEKEQIIFKKILNEDLEGALSVFEEIFDCIVNNEKSSECIVIKKKLKEFLLVLSRNIIYFWGDDFKTFKISKVEEDIDNMNDMIKINEYIKNLINEIIINISNNKKDKSVLIIEEVKSYINENYVKNISLEEVADHIQLSSHYLCKLFKKVEKANFKDYLIKVRMEEAKKMLRQGSKSIKEIALDIGYSDPNYFSRAFKKYVGKSATDYAKL